MTPKRVNLRIESQIQLADDLEDWSQRRSVTFDRYLNGLVDSLRTDENLGSWAAYPPMEWLPRPRSRRARRMGDIGRLIAITRNVLIFSPVAITWFAIGKATRAFDQYVGSAGATTANFLEFWQDGKGILSDAWKIGNVATLDFQLILILIVLSFTSGVLQARAIRASSRDATKFEQERMELSFRIDEILTPYRTATNQEISQSILKVIDKLDSSANAVATLANALSNSSGNYSKAIKSAQKQLADAIKQSNKASKDFKSSAIVARKNLDQLNKSVLKKKNNLK